MTSGARTALVVCTVLAVASAISVVYSKFASRKHFIELQNLRAERDGLEIEWGRLQLEQGTLATHGRVEQRARRRLGMEIPKPEQVSVIRP